jgi:aspartate-semialdehyde dehydrogenase
VAKQYRVAVVGATSTIGLELLKVLEQRNLPMSDVHAFASDGTAGRKVYFRHQELTVAETSHESFSGVDFVFCTAGANVSRHFVPAALRAGAFVIDNSDAWRLEGEDPLVVPEVNADDLAYHKGLAVNPTCTVIQTVLPLAPLHRANPLKRAVVVTFQSVSGAGPAAVDELIAQTRQVLDGTPTLPRAFPHQIAFNVLPEVDMFLDTGQTREEWKLVGETRRIMHLPYLEVSATCVRVPVFVGHAAAVHAEFTHPFPPEDARQILSRAPGIKVMDDHTISLYPQPWSAAGRDECYVGRIRRDSGSRTGLAFWTAMDNNRKGGALNAVQICEEMMKRGLPAPGGKE